MASAPALREKLDKLGLRTPTTLDEWRAMLTAFKDRDPNGSAASFVALRHACRIARLMELPE